MLSSLRVATLIAALLIAIPVAAADAHRKIVLIGGTKSEAPGRHDYPNAIRVLDRLLRSSPDFKKVPDLDVESYPDGWPGDSAFEGASTVVWYFNGLDKHPLVDRKRREHFEALMRAGVGLVVLHQATTVPSAEQTLDLSRSLGGARYGMFDRATETAAMTPATPAHPVSRGLVPFTYLDEFYPTIHWQSTGGTLTPILRAPLHVEWRDGRDLPLGAPELTTVAWAYERTDGGRAFGFTGAHYLASFDHRSVRKMLLNAIAWTAHIEVPADGVRE